MEVNNNKKIIGFILVLLFLYGMFKIIQNSFTSWSETYRMNDKQPYDTELFYTLLEDVDDDQEITIINQSLSTYIEDNTIADQTIITIGKQLYYNKDETKALIDFASLGNEVVLSYKNFTDDFIISIWALGDSITIDYINDKLDISYIEEDTTIVDKNDTTETEKDVIFDYFYYGNYRFIKKLKDSCIVLNITTIIDHEVDLCYVTSFKNRIRGFSYFDTTLWTDLPYESTPTVMGKINNQYPNLVRFPIGNGAIYLHSTPLIYTNYNLRTEDGYEYLNNVLASINTSNLNQYTYHEVFGNSSKTVISSPLKYIFSKKALRWAWYLVLACLFLFTLFYAKRRSRIIPLIYKTENTSIEFADSIGNLYYNDKKYIEMGTIMGKNFLRYIIEKYGLTYKPDNELFYERLEKLTSIEIKELKKLFNSINKTQYSTYWDQDRLERLFSLINKFKKTARNEYK